MRTFNVATTSNSGLGASKLTFQITLGFALLFATAQISIPLQPVPITLQTVGVMCVGLLFERRAAIYAVLSYLCLGLAGLPIFAGFSGGIHKLFGPTAGYLIGFFLAIWLMTWLRDKLLRAKSLTHLVALNCIGTVTVFLCGLGWLSWMIGPEQAFALGFMPFVLPGTLKAVLLALAVRYIKPN